MAKRYLVLSYMLLQGLSIVAMDNDADGSGNKLRSSGGSLRRSSELSKLRELLKQEEKVVSSPYFDSPCGGWIANDAGGRYNMSRTLAPVEEDRYRCP
ncbi:MAG TPA: hypothetical protein VJJ26_02815 [Candidatus Babeliales bacterium]|nr:hypothetical protein [Candidatus Babeliales bacterium]